MKLFKLYLVVALLSVCTVSAQQKLQKTSQTVNTSKDVTIDLNTNYTNIEIETWDKNRVEVTAFIEGIEIDKDELQEILEDWDVTIKGTGDEVEIVSHGSHNFGSWNIDFINEEAMDALRDLQINLAEIPAMPEMPEMPVMPEMPEMNFEMPEMPELPELPELPKGVHNVNFDSKAYEKEGEAYLERWSQEYEEKYGKEYKEKMKAWAKEFSKVDFDSYSAKMEEWGKKFGEKFSKDWEKDMEKWGEEVSKKFDEKWAKEMEEWGEKFGDKFGEEYAKRMEERAGEIEKRMEEREKIIEERMEERENKRDELQVRLRELKDGNIKRTIQIKMPKEAKLKVNVRHGELKFSSVIYNLKADLTYSSLLAMNIDGSGTSINASYSPIFVKKWTDGALDLKYVEDAIIQEVNALNLSSNSSNINIDRLTGNALIDGSFGDLTIHNISDSYNNLNIILENSDALVKLPKNDYQVVFKGKRSRFNEELVDSKTLKSSGSTGNKTILVNAKFSNVIMQ